MEPAGDLRVLWAHVDRWSEKLAVVLRSLEMDVWAENVLDSEVTQTAGLQLFFQGAAFYSERRLSASNVWFPLL